MLSLLCAYWVLFVLVLCLVGSPADSPVLVVADSPVVAAALVPVVALPTLPGDSSSRTHRRIAQQYDKVIDTEVKVGTRDQLANMRWSVAECGGVWRSEAALAVHYYTGAHNAKGVRGY